MGYVLLQHLGPLKALFSNNMEVHKQTCSDHFLPHLAIINKNTCDTAFEKWLTIALPREDSCRINTVHPLLVHETMRICSNL